ncbi:pre-coat protein [Tomato leaf curl Bangalore virus - [India:Kerala IV:2005]]|nr:pre-coat protein [Tomato leaf curl Bangalore virus - [India:Kerala IV:2005]]
MWDPLLNDFPETVHGFRCMLAIKYLRLVENTYSPDSLGYDLIRDLISVVRAKSYVQASGRYDHFRARLEVSPTSELNQPIQQACCCPHCPRHKGKGMGQQAHESEAHVLQDVQRS